MSLCCVRLSVWILAIAMNEWNVSRTWTRKMLANKNCLQWKGFCCVTWPVKRFQPFLIFTCRGIFRVNRFITTNLLTWQLTVLFEAIMFAEKFRRWYLDWHKKGASADFHMKYCRHGEICINSILIVDTIAHKTKILDADTF